MPTADNTHWDPRGLPSLRHRIETLRQQARQRAEANVTAVNNVAAIMLMAGLGVVTLILTQIPLGLSSSYTPLWVAPFLTAIGMSGLYGLWVLTTAYSLPQRHSQLALYALRYTSLGNVLTHDEYWNELAGQYARRHPLAPADRPVKSRIEEQLTWYAFHYDSLVRCYQQHRTRLVWRYAREQYSFALRNLYRYPSIWYAGCGCFALLVIPLTALLLPLFCWIGTGQVIGQARLVAICDYLLSEDEPKVQAGSTGL